MHNSGMKKVTDEKCKKSFTIQKYYPFYFIEKFSVSCNILSLQFPNLFQCAHCWELNRTCDWTPLSYRNTNLQEALLCQQYLSHFFFTSIFNDHWVILSTIISNNWPWIVSSKQQFFSSMLN